jgi:subtilisin family serine protease
MSPLELVRLPNLMALTDGRADVVVGLLDGPVALDHPQLASSQIRDMRGRVDGECFQARCGACQHGTFVAGIILANRGSSAPAICPGCSLLVRPIFSKTTVPGQLLPSATPQELAMAIGECIQAGARVLNLSAAMDPPSNKDEPELRGVLDEAARTGVLIVAAAGNQGTLGSSAITRHPWVLPVVGYGLDRRPMALSNLGSSMGKRGLGGPGENVTSLSPDGSSRTLGGTSFAAAFVTGAIALLWSVFPAATAVEIKYAVSNSHRQRRTSIAPPLLDAWNAYSVLSKATQRRATA